MKLKSHKNTSLIHFLKLLYSMDKLLYMSLNIYSQLLDWIWDGSAGPTVWTEQRVQEPEDEYQLTSGHTLRVGFWRTVTIFLAYMFITHISQMQKKNAVYLNFVYFKKHYNSDYCNVSNNIQMNIEKVHCVSLHFSNYFFFLLFIQYIRKHI